MEVGRSARQIIAAAELPEPIERLILHIIRKVRLWRRERLEVATELVAHFRDGLEAGRTVDDLLTTFGKRPLAIKLIRRAKSAAARSGGVPADVRSKVSRSLCCSGSSPRCFWRYVGRR